MNPIIYFFFYSKQRKHFFRQFVQIKITLFNTDYNK